MVRRIGLLAGWILVILLVQPGWAQKPVIQSAQSPTPNFWGMVVRDPVYEWDTNPAYPGGINRAFIAIAPENPAPSPTGSPAWDEWRTGLAQV